MRNAENSNNLFIMSHLKNKMNIIWLYIFFGATCVYIRVIANAKTANRQWTNKYDYTV